MYSKGLKARLKSGVRKIQECLTELRTKPYNVRSVVFTQRKGRDGVVDGLGGAICLEGTPQSTYRMTSEFREGQRTPKMSLSVLK